MTARAVSGHPINREPRRKIRTCRAPLSCCTTQPLRGNAMAMTTENPPSAVRANVSRPRRLHHAAWVTRDQEATRHLYDDLIGLPLVATWAERAPSTGREYCHTFFAF